MQIKTTHPNTIITMLHEVTHFKHLLYACDFTFEIQKCKILVSAISNNEISTNLKQTPFPK